MPTRTYTPLAPFGLEDKQSLGLELEARNAAIRNSLASRSLRAQEEAASRDAFNQTDYLAYLRSEGEAERGYREKELGLRERFGEREFGERAEERAATERRFGGELGFREKELAARGQESGADRAQALALAREGYQLQRDLPKSQAEAEMSLLKGRHELGAPEREMDAELQRRRMAGEEYGAGLTYDPTTGQYGKRARTQEEEDEFQIQRILKIMDLLGEQGYDLEPMFGKIGGLAGLGAGQLKRRPGYALQKTAAERAEVKALVDPVVARAGQSFAAFSGTDFDESDDWAAFDQFAQSFIASLREQGVTDSQDIDAAIEAFILRPEVTKVVGEADVWDWWYGGQEVHGATLAGQFESRLREMGGGSGVAAPSPGGGGGARWQGALEAPEAALAGIERGIASGEPQRMTERVTDDPLGINRAAIRVGREAFREAAPPSPEEAIRDLLRTGRSAREGWQRTNRQYSRGR